LYSGVFPRRRKTITYALVLFIKTRQNTPLLAAGMNGERGSRGCNPLERGFQRGCRPLWSRSGLMPRPRRRALRASEAPCGVRVYFDLEKYRKAISQFEKSEKSHNYQETSYSKYNCFYLGYCFLNLGNFKKAVEYFEQYLRFNKNDSEVLSYVGWCYMLLNKPSDALKTYLQGTKLQGNLPYWHAECARILMKLNHSAEAFEHLELAKAKAKDTNEKKLIKILEYEFEGKLVKAIESLKKVVNNLNTNTFKSRLIPKADYYVMMSRYQKEVGNTKEVLSCLQKAFEDNPNDLWVINELAMEYADQEIKLDKALKLINRALFYQPDNSIFIDTEGWILFKMGRKEEAKLEIRKSLALNPNCKDTQMHHKLIMT